MVVVSFGGLIFLDALLLPKIKVWDKIEAGDSERITSKGTSIATYYIITQKGKKFTVNSEDYAFVLESDSILLFETPVFRKTHAVAFTYQNEQFKVRAGIARVYIIEICAAFIISCLIKLSASRLIKKFYDRDDVSAYAAFIVSLIEAICFFTII